MIASKRYIFDTNVLISAHLIDRSVSAKAFDKAIKEGVILNSYETLSEFSTRIIRPKFGKYLSIEKRQYAINNFIKITKIVSVELEINCCRDPEDNKFLALAVAANADCIITGDKDLLILNPFENIRIITPADFLYDLSSSIILNEPEIKYPSKLLEYTFYDKNEREFIDFINELQKRADQKNAAFA